MKGLQSNLPFLHFAWLIVLQLFAVHNLSAQAIVTTYAGDGVSGFINGDTASCRFKSPDGICSDLSGNLFIADGDNHCIRRITPDGQVTTYAGTGIAGYADGPDSIAQFRTPFDVCADADGNLYVSDFENQYIRKIGTDGIVSTIAGNGIAGYSDGPAMIAQFNYPRGIVVDGTGNLYVSDSWNHRIRKIATDGVVTTYAGGGNIFGVQSISEFKDGSDTASRFYTPCGLSIDEAGNIYVADAYNHRVRKVDPSQMVTTVAGTGNSGATGGGFVDGDTAIARFNTPTELFASASGAIYVSDTYNNRMRAIENGVVTTIAGSGVAGYLDGVDSIAKFNHPRGVIVAGSGNSLLVADGNNRRIRRMSFEVTSGVQDYYENETSIIFPNPSEGIFNLNSSVNTRNIRITDVTGRILFEDHVMPNRNYSFDMITYQQGIYFAYIYTDEKIKVIRICKLN